MRARMALDAAGVDVEYREILLKDKPPLMLEHSAKGTVPVLVLPDGVVIDESLDVMRWALAQNDPERWLGQDDDEKADIQRWLDANDAFKSHLDRYKYETRYDNVDHTAETVACRAHMEALNQQLQGGATLVGGRVTVADIALFPFVRQFHNVDKSLLASWGCDRVQAWLEGFVESERFTRVMVKRSRWVGRGRTGGQRA